MKEYTNYSLVLVLGMFCFFELGANQNNSFSIRSFFKTMILGFSVVGQAAPTARVKIKPYAYFGTDSGLVAQDLYRVPASFAAVCCKKGALQKNPDCANEAIKIADAFDSQLVFTCCSKETLQERSNCFEFKKS